MGKGNRTKNEKAASVLASSAKKKSNARKGQMPTWVGTLILVAVLAVIVTFSVISVLAQRGVFLRNKLIAETDHFEVTVPMMSYMVYTEYQSWVSQYQDSGIMQYIKGNGGTALNTSLPLRDQIYSQPTADKPDVATMTWFDYFAQSATGSVVEVLTLCEQAHSLGVILEDEDYDSIESTMQMLELYAMASGYELNAYIPMMYGNGVRDKDVRAMLELTTLATKMTTLKMEELRGGATDVRVELYYEKNKADLDVYTDFIFYTFTTKFDAKDGTTDEINKENADALEKYQAEQNRYNAFVDELAKCTTAEEFCDKLEAFLAKSKEEGGEGMDVTDAFLAQSNAHRFSYKKGGGVGSKVEDFLFSKDTPAANTAKALKDPNPGYTTEKVKDEHDNEVDKITYSDATSTYTAVFVITPVHRDEAKLQHVGHILFQTNTYKDLKDTSKLTGAKKTLAQRLLDKNMTISAENMAKELFELMKEEGALTLKTSEDGKSTYYVIDKDKFEAYAKDYNEDGNVFYNDVARGDMVAEFDEWLYNPNRIKNEISEGGIKTTYGYHVMFYNGESETKVNWIESAREELATDDYEAWFKTASTEVEIETEKFQKNWKKVGN
ncbi:MAG: hypothetical protein IJC99_06535 [Clostridia bacterium]|nr:hypothetical protein [Clostridia bacterium]